MSCRCYFFHIFLLLFFKTEHDLVVYRRALWKLSGMQGSALVQGTMIGGVFDPTALRNEALLHTMSSNSSVLNLGKPHFFEM